MTDCLDPHAHAWKYAPKDGQLAAQGLPRCRLVHVHRRDARGSQLRLLGGADLTSVRRCDKTVSPREGDRMPMHANCKARLATGLCASAPRNGAAPAAGLRKISASVVDAWELSSGAQRSRKQAQPPVQASARARLRMPA